MTQTATKQQPETAPEPVVGEVLLPQMPIEDSREWQAERLRSLWKRRQCFSSSRGPRPGGFNAGCLLDS